MTVHKKIKAISLFSSAGIGELYFEDAGIQVVVANELIERRCALYKYFHKNTTMIPWDIRDEEVKKNIISYIDSDVRLLIATPPCQGLSSLWKNKVQEHYESDERNYLIFHIFDIIDYWDLDYILIENVPKFLKMIFPYNKGYFTLEEILNHKYSKKYEISVNVLDAKDYWVPQTRQRAIIRMYKKHLTWDLPKKEKVITLKEAIWHLPSLESWEKSDKYLHYVWLVNERYIEALRYTPTGKSAMQNTIYYPKKEDWERMKWFHNTFKRMKRDEPAPTRTTFCWNVNSHNNVHPWKLKKDWTYSDARPLSMLENFIVSSIPTTLSLPDGISETFLNTVVGEWIPPLMLKKILLPITH
ncbi:MAG: hypothetical protein ACD_80C00131G0012 [uncultured bacterium (gcode 4)]|uniref:DNA (cytosine-5-)-methyltransferase n=1 Tax=uncultured bacterium (gcode 4) TaxID=1234023 RepID=K1YI19_9BACT|nr:MAG: hypothetical protein ACD_80C00131G0012 [uncultured bacterium (gcode 4)]